jgi:SPP1 family predicted phage head-tail adaptor
MLAGRLRHRVQIQTPTRTRDAIGGITFSWSTADTRWASIEPVKEKEKEVGERTTALQEVKFVMRHYDGLSPRDRIVYGSNIYDIHSVRNIYERDIMTEAICTQREGNTSGSGS